MTIVIIAWGEYGGFKNTVEAAMTFSRCPIIVEQYPKNGRLPRLIEIAQHNKVPMVDYLSIARWVRLYELSRAQKLSFPIITLDWDVMVFRDLHIAYAPFMDMDFSVTMEHNCGSSAYGINNQETLNEFNAMLEFLVSKSDPSLANDMTAWFEFHCRHPFRKRGEMSLVYNRSVFDHNISCDGDGRFVMDGENKLVVWESKVPHFKLKATGELIRANWIHCWGSYKNRTAELLRKAT